MAQRSLVLLVLRGLSNATLTLKGHLYRNKRLPQPALFMAAWMIFRLDQAPLVIKSIKAPCAYLVKCAENSTYCPDPRSICYLNIRRYVKHLSFPGMPVLHTGM